MLYDHILEFNKMSYPEEVLLRFWNKVIFSDNGCWEWTGYISDNGYPRFQFNKKSVSAHRFIYECCNGPISNGLFVCHKCDNTKCVRPDHLFIGTAKENTQDMIKKDRSYLRKIAKLTSQDILDILNLKYKSYIEIMKTFDIGRTAINCIFDRMMYAEMTNNYTDEKLLEIKKKLLVFNSRLDEDVVRIIKTRLDDGETCAAIARDFNIGIKIISNIKTGKNYSHIV